MVQGRCPHSSRRKLCFDAADTSSTFLSLTVCKRESELPGLLQADVSGWDLITLFCSHVLEQGPDLGAL